MLSRYNFYKLIDEELIIYNSLSDALEKVSTFDYEILKKETQYKKIPIDLLEKLVTKDMYIMNNVNEIDKVIVRYNKIINSKRMHFVVLASTDCNFSCSYCYQDNDKMTINDNFVKGFSNFIKNNIKYSDGLYIDWFGGEPLLAKRQIVYLSSIIKDICKERCIPYLGSMTTNGFYLDDRVILDLINSGIKFFQVTLDGDEEAHNTLRQAKNGKGTYKRITNNLLKIKNNIPKNIFFRLGIRNNISEINIKKSSYNFYVENLKEDKRFSYFQYPIKNWGGERIKEIENTLIDDDEDLIDTNNKSSFFRTLTNRVCYVSHNHGYAITPDLNVYKCHHYLGSIGVKVKNKRNYVGKISEQGILESNEHVEMDWNNPCIEDRCYNCEYLPTCLFDICPLANRDLPNCRKRAAHILKNKLKKIEGWKFNDIKN